MDRAANLRVIGGNRKASLCGVLPFAGWVNRLRCVTLRRLAAFAIALTMLHLNMVRADGACAAHAGHSAASENSLSHEGMSHEAGMQTDQAPCETPSQPDCCQALASCAPVLAMDARSEVAAGVAQHVAMIAAFNQQPASRSTAPEPPPPKA